MTKDTVKINDVAGNDSKKNSDKPKDAVDVATLEKSNATSATNPKKSGPVAVGEASG